MHTSTLLLTLVTSAIAHIASWNKDMYCKGGNDSSVDSPNTNLVVNPLCDLLKSKWWMQADRGCDVIPSPKDEFLELPAGKSFMAELANNRAFTTLSYDGDLTRDWQDGKNRSMPWRGPDGGCLMDGGDGSGGELHTKNIESTGGTAWAISYESDISKVTMDNLVVFYIRYYSPFFRETWYEMPADIPACLEKGGQPNMYMQNHRCKVTGSTSTKKLGKPKPPIYCRDNPTKCVPGPKQMMAWNQAGGNNANPTNGKTPAYNQRMGFMDGAQDDIFLGA
ncbi:hypothetical protein FGRMN_4559 [Fusarium graminum]|nr:hypothetical protein FGRMN_4559 [Fusarium graminum]